MCIERWVFGGVFGGVLCGVLCGVLGCVHGGERTAVSGAAGVVHAGEAGRLDFWDGLRGQALASNADVVRAAVLFVDGRSAEGGYAGGVARLEELGLLGGGAGLEAGVSARVGMVAQVFGRLAGVPGVPGGGWVAGSVGEVTSTKRARAVGLLPARSANQAMSGSELIAVVRRAELYLETGGTRLVGEGGIGVVGEGEGMGGGGGG